MKKTLQFFSLCIFLILLIHVQINTINIDLDIEEIEETTISATNKSSSLTAAQLTKPTILSSENYSKDSIFTSSPCILICLYFLIQYTLNISLRRLQSIGFLFAVKYESNYLPRSINSF